MKFRYIKTFIILLVLIAALGESAFAFEPNYNYTYTKDRMPSLEPTAYVFDSLILGTDLKVGNFSKPRDVFVAKNKLTYVADTGNNRIIVFDLKLQLIKEIKTFSNNGVNDSFKDPCGIYVTTDSNLYVADSGNGRILVFNKDFQLTKNYNKLDTKANLEEAFIYKPIKVAVDKEERLYVVSEGSINGIIQLDRDGSFISYYGAIPVQLSAYDIFIRMISTEAQGIRQMKALPTVYNSIDIDNKNFVYGVVKAAGDNFNPNILVRKLNLLGSDILRRVAPMTISGDIDYPSKKPTQFIDVSARESGVYSILDSQRNRIFTYDNDGSLLYVFGGEGQQKGDIGKPEALATIDNDTFLVVDSKYNQIIKYKPTSYGTLINNAVTLEFQRKYKESEEKWKEVLKYSTKSELAYSGMGKTLLRQKNYSGSMYYFKLAWDNKNFSRAYEKYREILLDKYFVFGVFAFLITLISIFILFKILKNYIKRRKIHGVAK